MTKPLKIPFHSLLGTKVYVVENFCLFVKKYLMSLEHLNVEPVEVEPKVECELELNNTMPGS